MKKFTAVLLAVLLLSTLAACDKNDSETEPQKSEKVTLYVATEQKNYQNGALNSTTTYQYDACGRPVVVRFSRDDGEVWQSELTYDMSGNVTRNRTDITFAGNASTTTRQDDYTLTYTNGQLTHCDYTYNQTPFGGMDFSYDEKGNMVLVEYDASYTEGTGLVWHSFDYDENGLLIREIQCRYMTSGQDKGQYAFTRTTYGYEAGVWAFLNNASAFSEQPVRPEDVATLEFSDAFNQYAFATDRDGYLVYVGSEPDEEYQNGQFSIFEELPEGMMSFDEQGNLLKVMTNEDAWVEYTYEAIEVTKQEAQIAKQMMHGIVASMDGYYVCMDPIFKYMGSSMLYHAPLNFSFFYLIPYPMW